MLKANIFLVIFLLISTKKAFCDLNTGTVLFIEADEARLCWSPANVRLLITRMLVEDLLPCPSILGMMDDEIISNLLDYFKLVYNMIRKVSKSNRKNTLMLAFTDALGGYLRHVVLPNVKYSFYAGALGYKSVENILQLYKNTKIYLRTNGKGWADPICDQSCRYEPRSFSLNVPKDTKACEQLTLFFGPIRNIINIRFPCPEPEVAVPLPFFDRLIKPSVLAVPLKSYPLRGMQAPWGLNLVVKYYLTGYRCLVKHKNSVSLRNFNDGVFTWIMEEVMPMIDREEIYTTFGSVLRVLVTLQRIGARKVDINRLRLKYSQMLDAYVPYNKPVFFISKHGKIFATILLLIFLWLLVALCFYLRPYFKRCYHAECKQKCTNEISRKPVRKKLESEPKSKNSMCLDDGYINKPEPECICFSVNDGVYGNVETEEDGDEEESIPDDAGSVSSPTETSGQTQQRRPASSYTFGYDFQTSTSESASDSDSELDLHVHNR